MIDKLPISVVRNQLRDLVDDLYAGNGAVIITRTEKPMAVLISYDDYLAIEPTLHERHIKPPAPVQ